MKGLVWCVVGIGACTVIGASISMPVAGLSWADDAVQVTQGAELSGYISSSASLPECTLQWVSVVGYDDSQALCVQHAKDFSIATAAKVSPELGSKPYISIGNGPYKQLYADTWDSFSLVGYYVSPERNDLTVIIIIGEAAYVRVYANIHRTLRTMLSLTENGVPAMQYVLPNKATYYLDGVDDTIWARNGGLSRNGKYFAAQVYTSASDEAILRLDMDTFTTRVFSNDVYGISHNDAEYRIGVADSGQSVVLAGKTGNTVLYDLSGRCGIDTVRELSSEEKCLSVVLTPLVRTSLGLSGNTSVDGSKLTAPMFISDYRFTLGYFRNASGKYVELKLQHKSDGEFGLDYLALGDSYSSGEGDVEVSSQGESYYMKGTEGYKECHLSSRSYPFVLKENWGIAAQRMRSIACSGAMVQPDMNGDMGTYNGQHKELYGLSSAAREQRQLYAFRDFVPAIVPQIEFVRQHQPKFLTLTGGGNDIGFEKILRYCASSLKLDFTCDYAKEGTSLHKSLYDKIDTQYDHNKALIEAIKKASPDTRIAIIGYPSFIREKSSACWWSDASLDGKEKAMIDNAVNRTNDMLISVAYDTGVSYVDTYDTLIGGRICEGEKYVTGVVNLGLKKLADREVDEAFHPNAVGHTKLAERIYNSGVYDHDRVPVKSLFERMIDAVQVFSYEIVQRGIAYIYDTIHASFPKHTFLPGTTVEATAYSTPQKLGKFPVKSNGSVDMQLRMNKLSPGLHVLVIEGVDYRGDPVKFMQHIEIRVSESDADGDGIKDTDDPCTFVSSLRDPTTGESICEQQVAASGHVSDDSTNISSRSNGNDSEKPRADSVGEDRQGDGAAGTANKQAADDTGDLMKAAMTGDVKLMYGIIIVIGGVICGIICYIRKRTKR